MTQPTKNTERPRIGITLGDINGVGPEVTLKALADNRLLNIITPVVYGSAKIISFYKKLLNMEEFNYSQVRGRGQYVPKSINVVNCWDESLEAHPGKASPQTGKAALQALRQAATDLKDGMLDALVTAPIDKHTVHSDEFPFKGHTEFLAEFFGAKEHLMLLVNDNLRVGLVTGHVPIREVAPLITR